MPHYQNVCLCHYRLTGLVMTLTFDLENLFSNSHYVKVVEYTEILSMTDTYVTESSF